MNRPLLPIALSIAALAFVIGCAALLYQTQVPKSGLSLPSGAALFETSLQDRITSSDTSMTLVTANLRGGETLSGYNCFTIDEGRSDSEFVCGTVSGTSVTSLERGLSFLTGTTSVASLKFAHRKGANVKITDYPLIQRMKAALNGEDTIPNSLSINGGLTLGSVASYSSAPSFTQGSNQLVSALYAETYANNVVSGGAPTSTETVGGKVRLATAVQQASSTDLGVTAPLVLASKNATSSPGGTVAARFALILNEVGKIALTAFDLAQTYAWTGIHSFAGAVTFSGGTTFNASPTAATSTEPTGFKSIFTLINGMDIIVSPPKAVTLATSTGRVWLVDANVASSTDFYGFALSTVIGGIGTVKVQTTGVVTGFSGLTPGMRYYAQDTPGTIATTPGTSEVYVGIAISATELALDPVGAARGMQYLGSQVLTCNSSSADTAINQPFARFAIINTSSSNAAPNTIAADVIISAVGKTTGQTSLVVSGGGGTTGVSFTWTSTSSIRVANSGTSCSATAYYYR